MAFSFSFSLSLLLFASLSPAAEDPVLRSGESIVDVTVELTGPASRLLVLPDDADRPAYTYSAQGHYGIGGQATEEFTELPIVENYTWQVNETIAEIVTGGQDGDKSVTIRFRSGQDGDTAVGVRYTVTPGSGDAEEHIDVVVPTWSVGTPIQCGNIAAPADGTVVAAGAQVTLSIPQPTDDDTRTGEVTSTEADTCTVVWSADDGAFSDNANTGLSVVWIAPDEGENIPIYATIADAGIVPPRERGSRLDSANASTALFSLPDSSSFCCTSVSASPAAGVAAVASGASAGVVAVGSTTEGVGGGLVRTIHVNVAKIDGFLCDTNGDGKDEEYPANGADNIALPLGYSDGGGLLGSLSLSALSSLRSTLGSGEEAWPDGGIQWTGVIANEDGTATLDTTVPGTHRITVTCGTSTAAITIHIVEVAELECEGVVSDTDNPNPLLAPNVPVGVPGTVTITARLNPDDAPLDPKYLVWSGNGVAGNGCSATLGTGASGTYTVTLTCGTSVKRIMVNVVAISSLSTSAGGTATPDEPGSLVIPVYTGSDSIQIVATPTPAEASFPEDGLVWSGSVTGQGASVHLSTTDSGIYTAIATCGTSSATFNIRIVQVASVSCGGLVSTAAVPGTDETLNVPVGANDGLLTFSAESIPGDWPNTYPDWLGVTDSIGDTATLSTETPGTFLVEACCGNRKGIIVNVMGVNRLSCEGVASTTDTPGADETVCVPVGYSPDGENAQVEIEARINPDESPDWPNGPPAWTGVTASDGTTATLSTAVVGTYTVSCSYGTTKSLVVQVIGIGSALVRRVDQGKLPQPPAFASTATIAAGGLDNDVHKADVQFTLYPVPQGAFSFTLPVVVANADGYPDDNLPAKLFVDGEVALEGNGTANIPFSDSNTTDGKRNAILLSGNRMTAANAPCTVGNASITFQWDCDGEYDFLYADYFVPEEEDDINTFLTLQEVTGLDEDGDGNPGEGAIGGHDLTWFASAVTVLFWRYDYTTDTYDVLPQTAIVSLGTAYGPIDFEVVSTEDGFSTAVTVDSLIEIGDEGEPVPGHYTNLETVHDYIHPDGAAEEVVIVLGYTFAFQDDCVFAAPTAP